MVKPTTLNYCFWAEGIAHWQSIDLVCPGFSPSTHTKNHSVSQSNQPTKIGLLLENSVQLPNAVTFSPSPASNPHSAPCQHLSTWDVTPTREMTAQAWNSYLSHSPQKEHMPSQEMRKNITTLTQASRSFPGCRLTSPSPYFKHNQKNIPPNRGLAPLGKQQASNQVKGHHLKLEKCPIQTQWYTPVTTAFRRLRQEDGHLSVSLGYLVRLRPG